MAVAGVKRSTFDRLCTELTQHAMAVIGKLAYKITNILFSFRWGKFKRHWPNVSVFKGFRPTSTMEYFFLFLWTLEKTNFKFSTTFLYSCNKTGQELVSFISLSMINNKPIDSWWYITLTYTTCYASLRTNVFPRKQFNFRNKIKKQYSRAIVYLNISSGGHFNTQEKEISYM